jgi:DNA invertase Pin-like site-specific DNA recombinase
MSARAIVYTRVSTEEQAREGGSRVPFVISSRSSSRSSAAA